MPCIFFCGMHLEETFYLGIGHSWSICNYAFWCFQPKKYWLQYIQYHSSSWFFYCAFLLPWSILIALYSVELIRAHTGAEGTLHFLQLFFATQTRRVGFVELASFWTFWLAQHIYNNSHSTPIILFLVHHGRRHHRWCVVVFSLLRFFYFQVFWVIWKIRI